MKNAPQAARNALIFVAALSLAAAVIGCHADVLPRLEGTIILPEDDSFGKPDQYYRMAVMIRTEDGRKISDFFTGASTPGGENVGSGNAVLRIHYDDATANDTSPLGMFTRDFPNNDKNGLSLTFLEFKGNRYSIRNIPYGTAYIWLQTGRDGNRVTQVPIVVPITRDLARTGTLDIDIKNPRDLYFVF